MKRLSLFLVLLVSSTASAQETITTYYSKPESVYRDIRVIGALTTGNPSTPVSAVTLYGNLNVIDNGTPGTTGPGGDLTVTQDFSVINSSEYVLHVDSLNNEVGLGTNNPRSTLDVRGDVKSMILAGFSVQPPTQNDNYPPYADINAFYTDQAKFAASFKPAPGSFQFCVLHLDGAPIVFQSIDKSAEGVTLGRGRGTVFVRMKYDSTHPIGNDIGLVIGNNNVDMAHYGGGTPVIRSADYKAIASSRIFKTDIQPLSSEDYRQRLEALDGTNIVRFRYRGEREEAPKHLGLIAEEAPNEIAAPDKKSVDVLSEAYLLIAAAKGIREEQLDIKRRLEAVRQ